MLLPGLTEAFAGIQASVRRLRSHNDTGTLNVTASPSFAGKWLVQRLHRFQEQFPEVDVRISATDEIVDLTRGDFESRSATAPGATRDRGRVIDEERSVPSLQPRLLRRGPPLETPEDLARHALIHDQAVDRDPLAPTWSMWLKAAGVAAWPNRRASRSAPTIWRWKRRSAATASRSPTAP